MEATASQMAHLWDALCDTYDILGLDNAAGDEVGQQLELAPIIERTSKQDALRVRGGGRGPAGPRI